MYALLQHRFSHPKRLQHSKCSAQHQLPVIADIHGFGVHRLGEFPGAHTGCAARVQEVHSLPGTRLHTGSLQLCCGTRRRGRTEQEDKALEAELLADEKERAEHVMLVDLARNDVGRVARPRSIQLSDVMTIERYSHVMHIVSNVTGELAEGNTAFDALRASLPVGTVSGAPKIRAMEIIDEFEPTRRGPYAGAVGYVDFGGNMDTCIALRTMVISGGKVYVQVGAGIVADSVPAREYEETLSKARALLRAIEVAEAGFGE